MNGTKMSRTNTKPESKELSTTSSVVDLDVFNLLVHGDNIAGMKLLLDKYKLRNKVDLIYIDPPFATNTHFTIGEERANSVSKSLLDPVAYSDKLLGDNFLEFLRERLSLLFELM